MEDTKGQSMLESMIWIHVWFIPIVCLCISAKKTPWISAIVGRMLNKKKPDSNMDIKKAPPEKNPFTDMKRNGLLAGYGCVFPFSYFTSNGSFYTFFHSFIHINTHSAANLVLLDKVQNVMMIKSMLAQACVHTQTHTHTVLCVLKVHSEWTLVVRHFCLQ